MIQVKNISVTGFDSKYKDISWEITTTAEDILEYEFFVQRSEAEAGPYLDITPGLVDRYYVRDNSTPSYSNNRVLFYRIRVRHVPTGHESFSETATVEGELDLIALEIIRAETILFEEFIGTVCWLFPVRTFGQRCPQCWDSVMGQATAKSCPTCWGTGFSGGYHYPVQLFAQIDEAPISENPQSSHHHQERAFTLRCPTSPRIKPLDLLVDSKNRRMRVVQVHGTHRLSVRVRQEVSAVLVRPNSIDYRVPLNVDAEEVIRAGWRNFSNPQSIESLDMEGGKVLESLINRYG